MTTTLNERINQRGMPRTQAESASSRRSWLERRKAHFDVLDYRTGLVQAEENLNSWGVHAEDVGAGSEFRREMERGASGFAEALAAKRGIDWDALIQAASTELEDALKRFGVQEAFPAWWLLREHLTFDHARYSLLLKDSWIDRNGFSRHQPQLGLAPLRLMALYAQWRLMIRHALPVQGGEYEKAPFLILREVYKKTLYRGEIYACRLDFSDPGRPYRM